MSLKFGAIVPGTLEANRNVAEHLQLLSMAMSLEPDANRFKIKAFESAAESLILSPSDIRFTNPRELPGIGPSVAEIIKEFLETGNSSRYLELSGKYPVGALSMTKVDGIGPKGAMKFHSEGIHNFDELVIAANQGKLSDRVRDAVLYAVKKERVPHKEAKALAIHVLEELSIIVESSTEIQSSLESFRFEICGSIRRRSTDSKDVDIIGCSTDNRERDHLLDRFIKIGTKISRGENRSSIRFTYRGRMMQVDLWLVPPESYGSALNYATGPTIHNIKMRELAKSRNMLINEYGIFKLGVDEFSSTRLGGSDEHDIYNVLGLSYQEPWERSENLTFS